MSSIGNNNAGTQPECLLLTISGILAGIMDLSFYWKPRNQTWKSGISFHVLAFCLGRVEVVEIDDEISKSLRCMTQNRRASRKCWNDDLEAGGMTSQFEGLTSPGAREIQQKADYGGIRWVVNNRSGPPPATDAPVTLRRTGGSRRKATVRVSIIVTYRDDEDSFRGPGCSLQRTIRPGNKPDRSRRHHSRSRIALPGSDYSRQCRLCLPQRPLSGADLGLVWNRKNQLFAANMPREL